MIIYLASGNRHKQQELARILEALPGVCLRGADHLGGMPEVDENAPDFIGNARLKARALLPRLEKAASEQPGNPAFVLADDSGLEVEALGGAPGVYSARYAGPGARDGDNNRKLLKALESTPIPQRKARFVCVFVLLGQGTEHQFRGECPGHIALSPSGQGGFGYDPLFIPEGHELSFADLGEDLKNRISHRARAASQLMTHLRTIRV